MKKILWLSLSMLFCLLVIPNTSFAENVPVTELNISKCEDGSVKVTDNNGKEIIGTFEIPLYNNNHGKTIGEFSVPLYSDTSYRSTQFDTVSVKLEKIKWTDQYLSLGASAMSVSTPMSSVTLKFDVLSSFWLKYQFSGSMVLTGNKPSTSLNGVTVIDMGDRKRAKIRVTNTITTTADGEVHPFSLPGKDFHVEKD